MRTIENKVREALRDLGDQVAAGTQRPLRLPVGVPESSGSGTTMADGASGGPVVATAGGAGNSRQPWRWLAPAGAAASVLAIAITVAVVAAPGKTRPTPKHSAAALPGNVPPYYVALEYRRGHVQPELRAAVVSATATGRPLAVVAPPRPYRTFEYVSGAADDRTFVLAAQQPYRYHDGLIVFPPTRFFKLTLDPAAPKGRRANLTPLRHGIEPKGVRVDAMALSPDGSMLAVSTTRVPPPGVAGWGRSQVTVVNMSSGAERTWPSRAFGWSSLAWERNSRTLALFATRQVDFRWTVSLLDVAAPHSRPRVVSKLGSPAGVVWEEETITPDGRTVLASLNVPSTRVRYPWVGYNHLDRFDLRTGRLTGTVAVRKVRVGESDQVLWSDPSGRALVICYFPRRQQTGPGIHTDRAVEIVVDGHVTAVPWSQYAMTAAW